MTEAASIPSLPDDFVELVDLVPAVRLDVRYAGSDNFIGEPIDGYLSSRILLTRKAALALRTVQSELAGWGLGLKVFDGYRPQRAVDHFMRWAHDAADTRCKASYYPNLDKTDLLAEGYLSPRSAHSRGSTVDLTLVDRDGIELDMGTPFDFFDPRSWAGEAAVSAQQRANRLLLAHTMGRQGFDPMPMEWWHFTLREEPYPHTFFDVPVL